MRYDRMTTQEYNAYLSDCEFINHSEKFDIEAFGRMSAEEFRGDKPKEKKPAKSPKIPIPTESEEQQALFRWAEWASGQYPELKLLYHIPNEGKRSKGTGGRMRAEGLKKGVPDLCLPVPRGKYHGLYIEMKRVEGGKLSDDQKEWIFNLSRQGYCAERCDGWQKAAELIVAYLNQGEFEK